MIERTLMVTIGGIVTLILLILFNGPDGPRIVSDATQGYIVAVIIGAIAAWFWPVVAAIWAGRRMKARQQERIDAEVQRQLSDQQGKGGSKGY